MLVDIARSGKGIQNSELMYLFMILDEYDIILTKYTYDYYIY